MGGKLLLKANKQILKSVADGRSFPGAVNKAFIPPRSPSVNLNKIVEDE